MVLLLYALSIDQYRLKKINFSKLNPPCRLVRFHSRYKNPINTQGEIKWD